MMSENDLYQLTGNSYRGSRYANFVGGGVDAQGNVSSAATQNTANNQASTPSANTPQVASEVREVSNKGIDLSGVDTSGRTVTKPQTTSDLVIGATLPTATSTIGGVVGANIAAGAPATSGIIQGISDRISAGLLGSSATSNATNAALASMGGRAGPATQSAVSSAAGGSGIGSAAGTGIGTAAATLLSGGSIKDAAFQGVGAALGQALIPVPVLGSLIGSTIGGFVSKAFGGGIPRQTVSANIAPDAETGRLKAVAVSNKGVNNTASQTYADSITGIINSFADATGMKLLGSFGTESNVGKKDKKTTYGNEVISSTPGDAGAVALKFLKGNGYNYTLGDDTEFNSFWDKAVGSATDITSLSNQVDQFYTSRGLAAAPPAGIQSQIARRQGDRYANFYS